MKTVTLAAVGLGLLALTLAEPEPSPFDAWFAEHKKTCEICAGDELCREAFRKLQEALAEQEREEQRRRTKPDGLWHPKPTRPGYWWRFDKVAGTTGGYPRKYVRMEDGGLGFDEVGRSITDWGDALYFEQDMSAPESAEGWSRRVTAEGVWLNWNAERGSVRVSVWVRARAGRFYVQSLSGKNSRQVGGVFRHVEPPRPSDAN